MLTDGSLLYSAVEYLQQF